MENSKSMARKTKLILEFYKSYWFVSIVSTFICFRILDYWKMLSLIQALCIFKVAVLLLSGLYIHSHKKNTYYFYQNLGLSIKTLWVGVVAIDLLSFFTTMIITILRF